MIQGHLEDLPAPAHTSNHAAPYDLQGFIIGHHVKLKYFMNMIYRALTYRILSQKYAIL